MVECTRLESEQTLIASREFESPPLRCSTIGDVFKAIRSGARIALCTLALSAMLDACAMAAQRTLPLRVLEDVPLPGATSRFDYESLDPRSGLLFIAHLGAGAVIVFDTRRRRVIKAIDGIASVHGVLAVPELGRVYASATGTNQIIVIDERSLSVIARIPGGVYPDGLAYAAREHKIYVSDETGQSDTVIDARTNRVLATIALGSDVGNTQYDQRGDTVYVNLHSGDLAAIDPRADAVVQRYRLARCAEPHGLLLDSKRRRAYIACAGNAKLLAFDLRAHRVLQSFDIGGDPDVLAYDWDSDRLYVAGEDGIISVFDAHAGSLTKRGEAFLAQNAHVVGVDSRTHAVYFPLLDVGGRPVLRIMTPTR